MSDMQDRATCPHCGSELGPGAAFCPGCGNPVATAMSGDPDADLASMLAEEGIAVSLDDLGGGLFDGGDETPETAPEVTGMYEAEFGRSYATDAADATVADDETGFPMGFETTPAAYAGEETVGSEAFASPEPVEFAADEMPAAAPTKERGADAADTTEAAEAPRRPARRKGGAGLVAGAIAAGLLAFAGGFAGMTAILNALPAPETEDTQAVSDAVEKGAEQAVDAAKGTDDAVVTEGTIEDIPTEGPLGIEERFDRLALHKFLSHFSETGMFDRIKDFDKENANLEELDDFLLANGWQNHEPLPASSDPDSHEVFVPVSSADAMTDFYFGRRYDWASNPNFTTENGLSFIVDDVPALGPTVVDWIDQGEGNTVKVGFAAYSTPFSEMPNSDAIKHRDVENLYGLDDEGYAKTAQEMREYMGVAPKYIGTATLEATRTDDGHWRLILLDYHID